MSADKDSKTVVVAADDDKKKKTTVELSSYKKAFAAFEHQLANESIESLVTKSLIAGSSDALYAHAKVLFNAWSTATAKEMKKFITEEVRTKPIQHAILEIVRNTKEIHNAPHMIWISNMVERYKSVDKSLKDFRAKNADFMDKLADKTRKHKEKESEEMKKFAAKFFDKAPLVYVNEIKLAVAEQEASLKSKVPRFLSASNDPILKIGGLTNLFPSLLSQSCLAPLLKDALEKVQLNDGAESNEKEIKKEVDSYLKKIEEEQQQQQQQSA